MARPDEFTAEQVAEALRKARGVYAVAARTLGCNRQTIANYVNRYATVKAAAEEATATVVDVAESFLIRDVYEGKFDQIKYYLNSKGKDRGYGIERHELNTNPIDWSLVDDETLTAYCDGKLSEDDVKRTIIRQSRTRPS